MPSSTGSRGHYTLRTIFKMVLNVYALTAEVTKSWVQLSIENVFRGNFFAGQVFCSLRGPYRFLPLWFEIVFIDFGCLRLIG